MFFSCTISYGRMRTMLSLQLYIWHLTNNSFNDILLLMAKSYQNLNHARQNIDPVHAVRKIMNMKGYISNFY